MIFYIMKVSYLGFWEEGEEWLTHFISNEIIKTIKVDINDSPDILIVSCFDINIEYIKNSCAKLKIFYYGENLNRFPPCNDINLLKSVFDLIIGFNSTDINNKIIRFPLWLLYYDYFHYEDNNSIISHIEDLYKKNINSNLNQKTEFSSLITRQDMYGQRTKIYNEFSKYGKITCPSNYKNNCKMLGPSRTDKYNFLKKYTYNICPENSAYPGYCTEKIFHAFEAGCIPVYWGITLPEVELINENKYCFLNIESQELMNTQIKDVIENKEKYLDGDIFTRQAKYILDNYYSTLKWQISLKLNIIPKQKIYGISYASRHFQGRYDMTELFINSKLFDEFKMCNENDIDNINKQYIIYKKLQDINDNDILVYFDAEYSLNIIDNSTEQFNEYIKEINNNWTGLLVSYKKSIYRHDYFINKSNLSLEEQAIDGFYIIRKNKFIMDFFHC